jgi:hypothetical protein
MPISLQAALQEGFQVGGSTVESVNAVAASNLSLDFSSSFMTFTSSKGANASNSFAGSNRGQSISVQLNVGTGAWQASNGASGNLGGGALSTLQGQLRAFRNQLETFSS